MRIIIILLITSCSELTYSQLNCNNWLKTLDVGQSVKIGDLDVTGNQITVEANFNRISPDLRGNLMDEDVVSKHSDPNTVNYLLRVGHAEITTSNGFFRTPNICNSLLDKTYHVAFVYNGSTLSFYRNGFLMSQVPASGNLVQNNYITTIGDYAYPNPLGSNFIGLINEVRIWNIARTQAQIQSFKNLSLPTPSTQTGLLAYYTFDNLLNKQGNPLWNGTLSGAATINNINPSCTPATDSCSLVPVSCNTWLRTLAAGQSVTVGDLDITGNQITVEANFNRISPDLRGNLINEDIVSKHSDPNTVNYLLRVGHAEITTNNGFFRTPDICNTQLDKTYHIAFVYNGSTLSFYRNGFLMSQVPASGNLVQNNYITTIGDYAYPNPLGSNFVGLINEVRIWNVARTQSQIQTYTNSSLPNPTTQAGLLAYYTFDNLLNKQGNPAWNGTLTGASTINNVNPACPIFLDSCGFVIPVKLIAFNVLKQTNNVKILWSTAQEVNTKSFVIEHSKDAATWGIVANVPAYGNSSNRLDYSVLDLQPRNGVNYYRLKIIDNDGKFEYSPIKTITINSQFSFEIFPNPATTYLKITSNNADPGGVTVNVFDVNGRNIQSTFTNSGILEMNILALAKGVYFIQAINKKTSEIKKVIIE
ncbi:MAG TPA: LamG-like jellyroll fold domain-containing protein [Ferruginibacter sp.]|nr:LamG-like jellyroll fold domain-containing protein [Ferruginibacter sp.]